MLSTDIYRYKEYAELVYYRYYSRVSRVLSFNTQDLWECNLLTETDYFYIVIIKSLMSLMCSTHVSNLTIILDISGY